MGFWSRVGRVFAPSRDLVADERALVHVPAGELVNARALPPARAKAKPEEYEPIEQPGSTVWRTYPEEGITPERWRGIQKNADLGYVHQLMELYDAVASDYHVAAQLRTRKLSVAGAPVTFEPGDESDLAKRVAEATEEAWNSIPDPTGLLVDVLDDFYRGFSCVRPIWDSVDGQWLIVGHHAVESRYFRFIDATLPIITPIPGGSEGVPVPGGYFYSEFRDKAGPIVRAGVGRSVTRSWIYKGYALMDMASVVERFGTPHVQVKTERTLQPGDPALEQAKDAARAFIADQVGVLPAGTTLEVIDVINKAATIRDTFLAVITFHDLCISKAIVGQVLTADAGPGGIGHGGSAEEHGDVRQDLMDADATRTARTVDRGFSKPFALYHFGPNAPAARCRIDVSQPEDRVKTTLAEKQRAETLNILRSSGLPISKKQTYLDFGLDEPADANDTLPLPAPPAANDNGDPSGDVPAPKAATPAK